MAIVEFIVRIVTFDSQQINKFSLNRSYLVRLLAVHAFRIFNEPHHRAMILCMAAEEYRRSNFHVIENVIFASDMLIYFIFVWMYHSIWCLFASSSPFDGLIFMHIAIVEGIQQSYTHTNANSVWMALIVPQFSRNEMNYVNVKTSIKFHLFNDVNSALQSCIRTIFYIVKNIWSTCGLPFGSWWTIEVCHTEF